MSDDHVVKIPQFQKPNRKPAAKPKTKTAVARRGRPPGEAAIMAHYRSQLLAESTGSAVLNKIIRKAMNDEDKDQAMMLKFLAERILPLGTFEREAGKTGHVSITITTADATVTIGDVDPTPSEPDVDVPLVEVVDTAYRDVEGN